MDFSTTRLIYSMGGKGGTDDRIFEYLLKDYKRAELQPEEKERLLSGLETEASDQYGTAAPELKFPRRNPIPFIAAAAATLITVFGLWLFLYTAPLTNPVTVVSADTNIAVPDGGRGLISAPADAELVIESKTEKLVLSPGTGIELSGSAFRRFTGDTVNSYKLSSGEVWIAHEGGSFRLETSYGVFSPAGTVISCSVSDEGFRLFCLEGRVLISPRRGEDFFLEQGFALFGERTADGWSTEVIKTTAAAPVYLPEQIRSQQQPAESEEPDTSAPAQPKKAAPAQPAPPEPPATDEPTVQPEDSRPGWQTLWSAEAPAPVAAEVYNGRLYVQHTGGITAFDYESGRQLSGTETAVDYRFSRLYQNMLLGYDGTALEAVSADDGSVLWRIGDAPVVYAGFAAADGLVYLPSVDGKMYLYGAEDGSAASAFDFGAGLYGLPAVGGGRMVFSTLDRKMIAAGSADGRILWSVPTAERLLSDRPVFNTDNTRVLNYNESGRLFLLAADTGETVAETEYAPPMTEPPKAVGGSFIFTDAEGLKILDGETLADSVLTELSAPAAAGAVRIDDGRSGEAETIIVQAENDTIEKRVYR